MPTFTLDLYDPQRAAVYRYTAVVRQEIDVQRDTDDGATQMADVDITLASPTLLGATDERGVPVGLRFRALVSVRGDAPGDVDREVINGHVESSAITRVQPGVWGLTIVSGAEQAFLDALERVDLAEAVAAYEDALDATLSKKVINQTQVVVTKGRNALPFQGGTAIAYTQEWHPSGPRVSEWWGLDVLWAAVLASSDLAPATAADGATVVALRAVEPAGWYLEYARRYLDSAGIERLLRRALPPHFTQPLDGDGGAVSRGIPAWTGKDVWALVRAYSGAREAARYVGFPRVAAAVPECVEVELASDLIVRPRHLPAADGRVVASSTEGAVEAGLDLGFAMEGSGHQTLAYLFYGAKEPPDAYGWTDDVRTQDGTYAGSPVRLNGGRAANETVEDLAVRMIRPTDIGEGSFAFQPDMTTNPDYTEFVYIARPVFAFVPAKATLAAFPHPSGGGAFFYTDEEVDEIISRSQAAVERESGVVFVAGLVDPPGTTGGTTSTYPYTIVRWREMQGPPPGAGRYAEHWARVCLDNREATTANASVRRVTLDLERPLVYGPEGGPLAGSYARLEVGVSSYGVRLDRTRYRIESLRRSEPSGQTQVDLRSPVMDRTVPRTSVYVPPTSTLLFRVDENNGYLWTGFNFYRSESTLRATTNVIDHRVFTAPFYINGILGAGRAFAYEYNAGTGLYERGMLVESAKTNINYASEPDLADCAAASGGITEAAGIPYLARSLEFPANGALELVYLAESLTIGQPYVFSVYLQVLDGLGDLAANQTSGSGGDVVLIMEGSSGLGELGAQFLVERVGPDLYRLSLKRIATGAGDFYGVIKYSTNRQRNFRVSGFQIEQGSIMSSLIRTTGVPLTRNNDIIFYDGDLLVWPSQVVTQYERWYDLTTRTWLDGVTVYTGTQPLDLTLDRMYTHVRVEGGVHSLTAMRALAA